MLCAGLSSDSPGRGVYPSGTMTLLDWLPEKGSELVSPVLATAGIASTSGRRSSQKRRRVSASG